MISQCPQCGSEFVELFNSTGRAKQDSDVDSVMCESLKSNISQPPCSLSGPRIASTLEMSQGFLNADKRSNVESSGWCHACQSEILFSDNVTLQAFAEVRDYTLHSFNTSFLSVHFVEATLWKCHQRRS